MAHRAAALLLLALVAASCGFKHEPIGSLPQFPQTATDALDRRVQISEAPQRIVSLDPGLTEAAFEIGASNLLVGGTGTETYPPPATKLKPMLTPDGKPAIKAIIRAHPDLVILPDSLAGTTAQADALARRLAVEVYVTDTESVQGIEHDILQLGLMTGHGGQARGVFADMQHQIDQITKAYAGQPPVPVYIDRGYFYTIQPGGLAADLVTLAGGRNVAAGADVSKPFGPAQLRAAAPAVYLAVAGSGVTLQGLSRSPATRNLPAVKAKRFAIIPDQLLGRRGPRVVDSLRTLARAIHSGLQG
jgi:iron complex transport system substrate-binding protein